MPKTATPPRPGPGPSTKPRERRLTLDSIRSAKRAAPLRLFIMGIEGVGKSTFGSNAPAPVFLSSEDGIAEFDVPAFEEPRDWDEVLDALATLAEGGHDYKTLVVDTVDWLEPLAWRHVCKRNGWADIEAPGYGKGYVAALAEWRRLIVGLQGVRDAGMQVILLAHAAVKNFSDPRQEHDYQRYECKLHKMAAAVLREWVDVCGFATFDTWTEKVKGSTKTKAFGSDRRILHTRHSPAYDAKTRIPLPDPMLFDWSVFAEAAAARGAGMVEDMKREIEGLIEKLPEDKKEAAAKWAKEAGDDPATLARGLQRLRNLVPTEGGE